jgi:hypothetical protein
LRVGALVDWSLRERADSVGKLSQRGIVYFFVNWKILSFIWRIG